MTVDASRSCLGLGTCVGSAIPRIGDARVLRTAALPPALPGLSVSDVSLAPPLDAITRYLRSACRRHHLPGDGPNEAGQLACDRGGDDIGRLAGPGEPSIARAQPNLPLPGDVADRLRLVLLPQQQLAAEPSGKTVAPLERGPPCANGMSIGGNMLYRACIECLAILG